MHRRFRNAASWTRLAAKLDCRKGFIGIYAMKELDQAQAKALPQPAIDVQVMPPADTKPPTA